MSFFASKPDIPAPQLQPPPPPPKQEDSAVQEAMTKEKELARKRKGRQSTLLTSPTGLSEGTTDVTTKKTLLGQ